MVATFNEQETGHVFFGSCLSYQLLLTRTHLDSSLNTGHSEMQDMLQNDIILNFPEHGMHLRFEARTQRLRLIEVYDMSRLQVRHDSTLSYGIPGCKAL